MQKYWLAIKHSDELEDWNRLTTAWTFYAVKLFKNRFRKTEQDGIKVYKTGPFHVEKKRTVPKQLEETIVSTKTKGLFCNLWNFSFSKKDYKVPKTNQKITWIPKKHINKWKAGPKLNRGNRGTLWKILTFGTKWWIQWDRKKARRCAAIIVVFHSIERRKKNVSHRATASLAMKQTSESEQSNRDWSH